MENIKKILSEAGLPIADKVDDTFPCVTFAEFEPEHFEKGVVPVHVWSRKRGRREIKGLMVQIYDLLHDKEGLRYDSQFTFLDPDGLTHHGVITFRRV